MTSVDPFNPLQDYWRDAWQRSILFLDILRQRGNIYREHKAEAVPNVLSFDTKLVRDGRTLPRPVNYGLVSITPPEGVKVDSSKRPFIVVDPRAGHGPGIGGMKKDSEIGVALDAGHPCYFVGFLPEPVEGQTIEDVCRAEAVFVEDVAKLHADAEGKPVIIANCQAGWQTMMMAATNPSLAGPILLAGSPLSYWAGVHGKNPMRYLGGALGGTWMTALVGDLGGGIFDGANLVANFESQDLANTYWGKPYNVYANVDTEGPRFLDFETWWGSPVLLNASEMQWIADNLFVGNRLSTGALRNSDGVRIDLRNIKSPIIVFCSWGDNITPPQQALGWITDLYENEREIISNGQTIVYSLHQTIGHLGIFVSGKVATREHGEFTSCMDMIDLMPPGLYEAVITDVGEDVENPSLIEGRYLFSLQPRTLDDIRALGGNSPEDDLRFSTAARVSEINHGFYRKFGSPVVRAATPPIAAAMGRELHPNRLRFAMFSDRNPMMSVVEGLAENARKNRQPVDPDNPLLAMERAAASWISTSLETFGNARDAMIEGMFELTYGSPILQAMMGLADEDAPQSRRIERDIARELGSAQQRAELERLFEVGGTAEAVFRALIYVRLADGNVDERGFAMLKTFRQSQPGGALRTMAQLKELLTRQYLLVRLDAERAIRAIPALLPDNPEQRRTALEALRKMASAQGSLSKEAGTRLERVTKLFDVKEHKPGKKERSHA